MYPMSRVQIIDEAVCISLRANPLEKSMNLSPLFPGMGKGRRGSLVCLGEGKTLKSVVRENLR